MTYFFCCKIKKKNKFEAQWTLCMRNVGHSMYVSQVCENKIEVTHPAMAECASCGFATQIMIRYKEGDFQREGERGALWTVNLSLL